MKSCGAARKITYQHEQLKALEKLQEEDICDSVAPAPADKVVKRKRGRFGESCHVTEPLSASVLHVAKHEASCDPIQSRENALHTILKEMETLEMKEMTMGKVETAEAK